MKLLNEGFSFLDMKPNLYLSAYLRFVPIHEGPRSRRISMQNVEINQKVRVGVT